MEIDVVELPKLAKAAGGEMKDWLGFLASKTEEDIMQIAARNAQIKSALVTLQNISMNEEERIKAENRDFAIRDMKQLFHDGEKKGIEKGREKEHAEMQQKWDEDKRQTILRCLSSGLDVATTAMVNNVSEDVVRGLVQA